jgi:hypothetical protein
MLLSIFRVSPIEGWTILVHVRDWLVIKYGAEKLDLSSAV